MGYKDRIVLLIIFLSSGCAATVPVQKQAHEQDRRLPYYRWNSPLVQEVNVPGHVANGVFIPEHKELVIIKPGEWAQSPAYPIQSKEETYEPPIHDVDMDVADITDLPNGASASGDDR